MGIALRWLRSLLSAQAAGCAHGEGLLHQHRLSPPGPEQLSLYPRPDNIRELEWLPSTCAYRLIARGAPLPPWHPLVSGDSDTVHLADISLRGFTVNEDEVNEDDYEDHIIRWVAID